MDASSPCPDASRLRALLGGGLSAAEQAELTAHLDACPRCRQRLEQGHPLQPKSAVQPVLMSIYGTFRISGS